ncbi:hypothetical protein L1049_004076 [Liquidambar formosana]|uniref:IBH1-like N-terminal domain-containing protein n=1 Tax=Liquidambar formosana TaxID=63359 RepID=A0AAP0RMM2_LIQFO
MNPQNLSLNPTSIRSKFTKTFLRALTRINNRRPPISPSREIYQRYRRVKIAADASMASAVGSRRTWSRAILWKIRNQRRYRALVSRRISTHAMTKRDPRENYGREVGHGSADELRRIVPGGEAMDFCSLLGETAHYIKCLNTQVQVMRSIADLYST